MDKILNRQKTHKWIIGITIVLFSTLSMIDTPFVLNGFFMSRFWDITTTILFLLVFLELNVLGIRDYPLFKRIYMHSFTVLVVVLNLVKNDRVDYLVILFFVLIASGFFINDYNRDYNGKKASYPQDRMFYVHILSILLLVYPLTDITVIQDGKMILVALGVGLFVLLCSVIVMLILKINLRHYLEIILSMIVILPLIFFVVIAGLNYAMDDSIPETNAYKIVDFDVDSGPRTPTTYKIYFVIEGKEEHIGVDKDLYYSLELGDDIDVSVYEGFFGFEYLIHE